MYQKLLMKQKNFIRKKLIIKKNLPLKKLEFRIYKKRDISVNFKREDER